MPSEEKTKSILMRSQENKKTYNGLVKKLKLSCIFYT